MIMIFFPLGNLLGISLKLVYFLNGKLFFFHFSSLKGISTKVLFS